MRLDIIVPVGPGHEQVVNEAIQSIKIACLTSQGPFDQVKVKVMPDVDGKLGRSAARNGGIRSSDAMWLFFLDADDVMHPYAMRAFAQYAYTHDAVWGNIAELHDGCIVPRFQMPRIEDFETLLAVDPFYTLQMGFFVRREIMPYFDESMNCGEDWKVYLDLWKKRQCLKVEDIFMVNRRGFHSRGPRSATGRDWMDAVHKMIKEEVDARSVGPMPNRAANCP